jgi:hypothetical protein
MQVLKPKLNIRFFASNGLLSYNYQIKEYWPRLRSA